MPSQVLTCFCFLSASVNQRVVTHLVSVMEFRVFFDVLPYALRNEELRKREPTTGIVRSSSTG